MELWKKSRKKARFFKMSFCIFLVFLISPHIFLDAHFLEPGGLRFLTMKKEIEMFEDSIIPLVDKRLEEIDAAISLLQRRLKKSPEGVLYGSRSHSKWQWQHLLDSGRRLYLPQSEMNLIKGLAQKKYDGKVLSDLLKQRDALNRFRKAYVPSNGEIAYDSMPAEWQAVVEPLIPQCDAFIESWVRVRYKGKGIEGGGLKTGNGELVRSKSEIIIANVLAGMNIPYRYEFPHVMKVDDGVECRNVKFYPDFTCLNVRTRKEVLWEHFGLMDNPDYAQNALGKLDVYQRNGFEYGKNFIFSFETKVQALDVQKVKTIAERFLV